METVLSRSKNDLYIVMRRGALRTIVGTACSAVMLALALGVALGHSRTEAPRVYREPPRPAVAAAPYTAAEFARLQAANASLDARVERLATQLDTLSAFDQRLRARLPRANATSTAASARASYGGAMGGPELPPRPCSAAGALSTPQVTRAELDCISTTVDALEQGAASHEAAWKAFPGAARLHSGAPVHCLAIVSTRSRTI